MIQVAFSPDGRRLAATTMSGHTYVYVVPADELVQLVKSRIFRPLTPAECQQYLHQKTCPLGE